MKIITIQPNPEVYSCKAYLILGDWNDISNVNTLIDTGSGDYVLKEIKKINTGVGKVPVERVILTHNHFDHTGGLKYIIEEFNPEVCAFNPDVMIDRVLKDKEHLKAGDGFVEIIHTPLHSEDSICIRTSNNALFSGDTSLVIRGDIPNVDDRFLVGVARLAQYNIEQIYPGHDNPVSSNAKEVINDFLAKLQAS